MNILLKNSVEKVRQKKINAMAIFERTRERLNKAVVELHDLITLSNTEIQTAQELIEAEKAVIEAAQKEIVAINITVEKISALY